MVFGTDPPPGYTFIAAGDPDLTRELKEIARRDGKKIYSVTVRLLQGVGLFHSLLVDHAS